MPLADLQRHLAAGLAGRGPGPEGMDREALERARRSLESKRRRAASHLLPRLRAALGTGWKARFAEHAARYTPSGLLYHVDDAWEMAETVAQDPDQGIAAAARDDLVMLRLRWVRRSEAGAERIRERRGVLIALVRSPVRVLLFRLPGTRGKVWRIRVGSSAKAVETLPGPQRHPWEATGTAGRLFEGLAVPSATSGERAAGGGLGGWVQPAPVRHCPYGRPALRRRRSAVPVASQGCR